MRFASMASELRVVLGYAIIVNSRVLSFDNAVLRFGNYRSDNR